MALFNRLTKGAALAERLQASRVTATSGVVNSGFLQGGGAVLNPGTSSYTITATDFLVVTSGACNPIQLPSISGNTGRLLVLISSSGTIVPASAQKINATTSALVFTQPLLLLGGTTGDGWRTLVLSTS